MPNERRKITSDFPNPGKTQQHFKDECDVNNIVKRFAQSGVVDHLASGSPRYGYCSSQSFTEAQFLVAEVRSNFERLPSATRAHFNNDAAEYIAAHDDEERRDELVTLGLAEPLPEPPPEPEEIPEPPPAEPPPEATPEPE